MKNILEIKNAVLKVSVGILLVGVSFSAYSEKRQRPKHMKYDPSLEHPYVYGNYENIGVTKEIIQWKLILRTDDPEEFKKVFEYFNQFDGGLDINWISKEGLEDSYLTRATGTKDWEIVPYLLSKGINVNHQDTSGITALMYAAFCGHLPTIGRLIIDGNADMSLVTHEGNTSLDAAKYGQQDNHCPEGTYEDVIDYIQTAMTIENPDGVKQTDSPNYQYQEPVKYAAIAYKEGLPFLRAFVKDKEVSADFEAVQKCNQRVQRTGDTAGGEECQLAAGFSSGQCGAYALSRDETHWGVGTGEDIMLAEQEALEQCAAKSNGSACNIDISHCQN